MSLCVLPSKLTGRDLRTLLATGKARAAGLEPVRAVGIAAGEAVEAERTVSARGTFLLAGQKAAVGKQHARAVVQVAADGGVIHVFHAGALIRTVARTGDKHVARRSYNETRRRTG